ncbi:MAG: hypothetical protein ACKOF9_10305 [Burkholderiales bacterium]
MNALGLMDWVWHVLNFLAPAVVVGLLTTGLVKLVWWRSLRGVGWWRLSLAASSACALGLVAGLVIFGRDGKMATYGLMLLLCTLGVGWFGLRKAVR